MSTGPMEILVLILLLLLLFGAGRVPAIMENLAKGINSFKKGLRDGDGDDKAKQQHLKEENKET